MLRGKSLMAARRRAIAAGARGMADAPMPPIKQYPWPMRTRQFGVDILHEPLWNKGTAFDMNERDRLGLRGLLPPAIKNLSEQVDRAKRQLDAEKDNESKNMYLQDLQNRNETLYFNLLVNNIETIAPLVYTPTVGTVCEKFGNQFRRTRGMYFSRYDRGHMSSMIYNWPQVASRNQFKGNAVSTSR